MSEIARMWATVGADTSAFNREMSAVNTHIDGFKASVGALQTATVAAFAAIGVAVAGAGIAIAKTGFDFLAMKEQANIAFTTMLGSGAQAKAFLDDLQDFAAKTPFEFPDLVRASQRLLAMGFAASEIRPTLTAVGDAVAALGGSSAEIDRVTTALGQMNAKGKTSAEEMMQLTEAGIPAWQMLADKIGVSVPEAMKMVSQGAVSAKTTIDAVVEGINQRFGGMMEKQSQTWDGLLSTLKDNFTQLSGTVMAPFFEMARKGLAQLVVLTSDPAFVAGVRSLAEWFAKLSERMAALVQVGMEWAQSVLPPLWERMVQVTAAIQAIIKPISDAILKFISWKDVAITAGILIAGVFANVIAAMAPFIVTLATITAAVAALRFAWEQDFMGIRTYTKNTLEKISTWFIRDSGIWKGNWQDTGLYILDRVRYFFEIAIPYTINGFTSGAKFQFQQWFIWARDRWDEWSQKVKDTVAGWATTVTDNFIQTKDKLITAVQQWVNPIKKDITDWATVTESKLHQYWLWVEKYFRDAKDWIIEKWEEIIDWWDKNVQPWIDKAIELGKDIIDGLKSGMQTAWTTLKNWWNGLWLNDLVKTVEVKMETRSPSKVMEKYGAWTMEGFGVGAEKMLPYVQDVMGGIPQASMAAGDFATDTGGFGGGPAVSTARIEYLLEVLIATLRDKNMNVSVAMAGGGDDIGRFNSFENRMRR